MRRTPGSRPPIGSTRRIDTLRPATAASRPFTTDGPDRHPSRAPVAWIETLDRLDAVDRHPSPAHRRIESLHNGQRESTPFPCAGRPDRDPRPAPSRGSTPFGPPLPHRDPSHRTARIDTLPARQSPGSRPLTGSMRWIDTPRPPTAGSSPFTTDSANRHPSRAPVARIETLDRLHLADRHPSAHHCRIEAVHTGQRGSTTLRPTTAGSRPFTTDGADRHPSHAP